MFETEIQRAERGKKVKGQKGQKRSQGSKKVKPKVRVNALPFMPFYDVLCPLVLENEKGQKGSQRAERVQRVETARQREVGYHKFVRQVAMSYCLIVPLSPFTFAFLFFFLNFVLKCHILKLDSYEQRVRT